MILGRFVVRLEEVEEWVYMKMFVREFVLLEEVGVLGWEKVIEGIEGWKYVVFVFEFRDVEGEGI